MNQCWNIVNSKLRNKLQWNSRRNSFIFILENAFENVVCEMASIWSRPQWVNCIFNSDSLWLEHNRENIREQQSFSIIPNLTDYLLLYNLIPNWTTIEEADYHCHITNQPRTTSCGSFLISRKNYAILDKRSPVVDNTGPLSVNDKW